MEQRMQSNSDMIKILIDIIFLVIKLNGLIKNYECEFVECINLVLKTETMSELIKSLLRTLIMRKVLIFPSQMLNMYFKYRTNIEINVYHILSNCEFDYMGHHLSFDSNKKFYDENQYSLQKMAIF
ncbi:hypothetical protein RF11_00227 [Thelohanellus kitauei]|uniref:Uncharacterized protein n=1 Tax=Thelohanellus kitauei TaxID=669202 RepID=A0A0C2NL51_THEKT|nr:hypothetical protein RF11_00227 [Thelohanellus kitauei]